MNQTLDRWREAFPAALEVWSRFTKLSEPRWCLTEQDETDEGLTGSFAMIRLNDHVVVISIRQAEALGIQEFATEILAHEIGHHVYAPGDLRDQARLMARLRQGLPTCEHFAGMVGNLYTDLLINDRLHRQAGLNIPEIYRRLAVASPNETPTRLWTFYMRTYEILWGLPSGDLAPTPFLQDVQLEAELGARLIRVYAKDWLRGAGRFACLVLRFLLDQSAEVPQAWMDASSTSFGGEIPDGLTGFEEDELEGAIHPAFDPELTGLSVNLNEISRDAPGSGGGRAVVGGQKNDYRSPAEYVELMKSIGVEVDDVAIVARYYRERALPHVIRFPTRRNPSAVEPHPEGVDAWEPGQPLSTIDWVETAIRSPRIIPGVTTVERLFGESPGGEPSLEPIQLYLGIDCSGSMGNPGYMLSYPVLAGAVMVLSALRAKAPVMVCLSGEPGEYSQTKGFIREERTVLNTLTSYLGTGYAFGIQRLEDQFMNQPPPERPTHALVISDSDMFMMINSVPNGREIVAAIPRICTAGATMVLQIIPGARLKEIQELRDAGWKVHIVTNMEEVVAFATQFSRSTWET